jgi:hypothetical protein
MGSVIPITDYSAVADWKPNQAQNGSYNPGFSARVISNQPIVNRNPFSNLMTPQANSFPMLQSYGGSPYQPASYAPNHWGLTQNFSNAEYPLQSQVNYWPPNPLFRGILFRQ